MSNIYQQKYQKYKLKYLNLLNQSGGHILKKNEIALAYANKLKKDEKALADANKLKKEALADANKLKEEADTTSFKCMSALHAMEYNPHLKYDFDREREYDKHMFVSLHDRCKIKKKQEIERIDKEYNNTIKRIDQEYNNTIERIDEEYDNTIEKIDERYS